MKIIAGERKGHTIQTPEGTKTRPTLSRVREALFSIIAGDVPDAVFCELYAGSGSIGLEALSRGAKRAIFVELAREPFRCLNDNVTRLRYTDQAELIQADVLKWSPPVEDAAPDIIFADPPYASDAIDKLITCLEQWPMKPDTLVIVQSPTTFQVKSGMQHLRTATYGATALHFYLGNPTVYAVSADQPATDSR